MAAQPDTVDSGTSAAVWRLGKHLPHLDGVRGMAILIVTLYRFSKELPTNTEIGRFLKTAFAFGDRGVDLFFVLSGFLITGILFDAKGKAGYFKNFFARRSLRIFPLYFFALFLFLVVVGWFGPYREMFAQAKTNQFFLWTYLVNVKMSLEDAWCFGYLDHFWSLAVEEHFYLVWPLVIFFCSRRVALLVAFGLALLSAGSRIVFAMVAENGVAPDVLTLFRCDALLLGSCLALLIRGSNGLQPLLKWSYIVFPACLLIGVGCGISGRRVFTISHTLWPLIWCCVLIWLLNGQRHQAIARLFNLSILRRLGKYSYAMYVFQSPLIPLTAGALSVPHLARFVGNEVLANLAYILIMSLLTYGAALLSWHLLEKHCLKLKKWFEHSPPASSYSASAGNVLSAKKVTEA